MSTNRSTPLAIQAAALLLLLLPLAAVAAARASDSTCGLLETSNAHGYRVLQYKLTTSDNYELTLFRLIHPSDLEVGVPAPGTKKPYLMLHGLVGSAASFVSNVLEEDYKAPGQVYASGPERIYSALQSASKKANSNNFYGFPWASTADRLGRCYKLAPERKQVSRPRGPLANFKSLISLAPDNPMAGRRFAHLQEIDFSADTDRAHFGPLYKRAYSLFDLPADALPFLSSSSAFSLSNFGYDVWLLNLRGNSFSQGYRGKLSPAQAEYWNFGADQLIKEDLPASIQFVARASGWQQHGAGRPMGLVSYSYSNLFVLGLLKLFPSYQERLQPLVMLAPVVLTKRDQIKFDLIMRRLSKVVMGRNGPFPSLGRATNLRSSEGSLENQLERQLCKVPLLKSVCRAPELLLLGGYNPNWKQTDQKKLAAMTSFGNYDKIQHREHNLMLADSKCGQTSKMVLSQVLANLKSHIIPPNFNPMQTFRLRQVARRSIILIHSQHDDISTPDEVAKLRERAIDQLTLVDYLVEEPNFVHSSFLFSDKTEYLINAELIRNVLLFDYLIEQPL